ncbi:MAG TPA: phosphatase PAP2 family protein [Sphingobium sp.]
MPIPLSCIVSAVMASLVLLALLMMRMDLRIALNGGCAGFGTAVIMLLLLRHLFRATGPRPRQAVSDCAEDVLLFMTMALAGATASYAVAACTQGWVDHAMVRLDHAMGFDWRDLYAVTAAHPALQISGRIAYASIFASPAILLLGFARAGQRVEARLFLATFWVAAVLSLCLFLFMPTLGPLSYMWQGPISYMPTSGVYQAELIPLLREHHLKLIDLGALRGLVGPPSFHACCAMLYIITARNSGALRAPLTLLNVAMLFAIPVEGTHYVTDIIGGVAVALAAHGAVTLLARSLRPLPEAGIDTALYGVGAPAPEAAS